MPILYPPKDASVQFTMKILTPAPPCIQQQGAAAPQTPDSRP
jgi:hypothetical protein